MPSDRLFGLGVGDLLTVREACRALRMREGDGRRWLDEEQLVRRVAGRPRVVWGDVLARIRATSDTELAPDHPAPVVKGLRRSSKV